jgi:farnesyl diphosphate synthase
MTKGKSPLKQYMRECRSRVEKSLEKWLPPTSTQPEGLHSAMRYAALSSGKRVRPILVYAAGRALGVESEQLDGPACAVELIHAYSLVHDDLPAMDDDDLRRGKPTCHIAFNEATAILAGDALQTLAFKVLCRDKSLGVNSDIRLQMIEALALASGSRGMVGGQAIDLDAVGQELNLVQLENMHIHKTGALIRASVSLGTMAQPDADPEVVAGLDHYAKCIGLAFQVQDDILDVEGDAETMGKTKGSDQAREKPTYPALLGVAGAKEKADQLHQDALNSISSLDERADPLRWLADYIVERRR